MRGLLESAVWLLVSGPKEEERGTEGVVDSFLFACLVLLSGISLGSTFNQFNEIVDRPIVLFIVAVLLLSAVLHALPTGWRRARLGTRVALTLTIVACIVWFPIVWIGFGSYGAPVAALLVLAFLWFNHAVNRRRALRPLSPPRRIRDHPIS